ncbi:MAG: hypothetical protein J7M38_11150, partial [Armatimonadetes bacterium]|nr:hypothetical protein [Armatimonadota bacterium]
MRWPLLLAAMMMCAGAHAALEDMIPAARQVQQLDVAVPVAGGAIRLVQDTPRARIAAGEINSRIEELGGEPLAVSGIGPDANLRGEGQLWIV